MSVKKAGGLEADAFGCLAFDVVGFLLTFLEGATSTCWGMILSPNVSDSARALRVRLVTGMFVTVC